MIGLASILLAACATLPPVESGPPEIAVIIDDIGYNLAAGRAAIELELPFSYAVLPFSPHGETLANAANALGKDVLLHLPMEAESDNQLLGPGALRLGMSQIEIRDTLTASLDAVPHAIGINNHMGSRLTREALIMDWLMQDIRDRGGFFFIDSRTTPGSVAMSSATHANVAAAARDVFIDNIATQDEIEQQLAALVTEAQRNGHALGIAHPHPATVEVLSKWDPVAAGVRLIGIGDYVAAYTRPADAAFDSSAAAAAECGDERNHAYSAQDPDAYW